MRLLSRWLTVFALAGATLSAQQPAVDARRRATLDELLRILAPSRTPANGRINAYDKTWEGWIARTGELPPDFDAMPSMPELPDPLLMRENGGATPVTTPAQWTRQKQLLRDQVQHWIFGTMPPRIRG